MNRCRSRCGSPWPALLPVLASAVLAATTPAGALSAQPGSLDQRRPNALADPRDLAPGQLLVARRGLADPNFAESVVLLFAYSANEGAAGLIINRRTSVSAVEILPDMPVARGGEALLFFGGPVVPDGIRGLLRSPLSGTAGLRVLPDVTLVATRAALEDAIAEGATPERLRLYGGYAGWGPGQLEREIVRGDWYLNNGQSKVIFAPNPATVWREQLRLVDVIAV